MAPTLGQLIRERRMELNLTQEELAERVGDGVRQSEISRLEKNRVTLPRRQRMEQIAEALDIPVGVLLSRSGWAGAETFDTELADLGVAEPLAPSDGLKEHALELDAEPDDILPPDHVGSDNHNPPLASLLEDSSHLSNAVTRAEALLGESRSIYTEAQTTFMQARESLKRRQLDKS